MKLSVKFREEFDHKNPLVRAQIPVTIVGLPFHLGVTAGDSPDFSLSLRSNFSYGPSLSFSYRPTVPNSTQNYPISVGLKSGIGVFGSPNNSALIFNANFNLFSSSSLNPNSSPLVPMFSLQFKPQLGDFKVSKSVTSNDSDVIQTIVHLPDADSETNNWLDNVPPSKKLSWRDLRRKSSCPSILSGIFIAAKTRLPLAKMAVVNFKWGVNFPPECNWQTAKTPLPTLVVNKISLEKIIDLKKQDEKKVEGPKCSELELLSGVCSWIRREVQDLQTQNRDIRHALEEIKLQDGSSSSSSRGLRSMEKETKGKRLTPSPPRQNSGGGDNGESGESFDRASEVEIELQKAIKAASS